MKKIYTIVALLMATVFILSSCGASKVEEKKEETTKAAETQKKEEAKEQTDDKAGEKVELVYWSMWNSTEPQAVELQKGIESFMQEHPNVEVTVNWNGREIRKTLQPALDNGQKIDIWDEDVERITKNWSSYAIPLEDYVKKSYDATGGKPYEEVVMKNLQDLGRGFSEDGQLYCIPYQPFVFAFMYNKDHFDQAGVTKVPETWDEFVDTCAKLKEAGFVPLTVDDAYVDTLLGYHLARHKGSAWVEELVKDKSNEMWDDEAVMATAKAFEELASNGYWSETVASNKWPAGQQDIALGTVSMYLNGTWLVNEIMGTTGPDFRWGTFNYPTVEGGATGLSAANYGAQGFQISKNCENPDVAFELLVHLTTGQVDNDLAKGSFGVPVGKDSEWPSQLQEAKAVFENLDTVYPWAGGIQADTDKLPIIAEQFTNLIAGKITAEEFVAEMKK